MGDMMQEPREAPTASAMPLVERLKLRVHELGFSLFGVTQPAPSEQLSFYRAWIENRHHGEMQYLARADSIARRADLSMTMGSVRSIVTVGHEYYVEDPPEVSSDPSRGVIARYARGHDYHAVIKDRLEALLEWLDSDVEGGVAGRAYVDTGPILERELAQRAGFGWIGRNTMLINPRRGSYFFLGTLLIDLELPASETFEDDRCGSCHACIDACPTGALLGRDATGAPVIDARRCISYLTIELRGSIPEELRAGIGNRIFGCDICQEVCPWNERFATPTEEAAYAPSQELDGPALIELADRILPLSGKGFARQYLSSPLLRTGRKGLLRNVCVALGNWGSPVAIPTLVRALTDSSSVVRGHAAWALGSVGSVEAVGLLSARLTIEPDEWVRGEIQSAVSRGNGTPPQN
jgi:epoxyqueuosine reductase